MQPVIVQGFAGAVFKVQKGLGTARVSGDMPLNIIKKIIPMQLCCLEL